MSTSTLIRNARLVNEGQAYESDLLVRDGRIARIDGGIAAPPGVEVVEADGRVLLPGVIDDQVHFREPGLTHKGCIRTESRAAVAGGVTTFMDMPNTRPPTTKRDELERKYAIAARDSAANYGFYFGASNDNIAEIRALDPPSTCGVKIFMGSSTGNMLVDDPTTLAAIFRDSPVPIATHCESTPMIEANLARALQQFGPDIPVSQHPVIRSAEACYASTEQAVGLAKEHGAQLHVLHLSTARELVLFDPGPLRGKSITAETCVHYLHFTDADYASYGNRIKCNPAIKRQADQDALLEGLRDGRIDIIATDHAPHTVDEKAETDYRKAPSGLPLIQDHLLACLELFHDAQLDLPLLVTVLAHNPATRFGVRERGFLREGFHADLVLVDLEGKTAVTKERVLSRCGWSPFEGRTFRSSIDRVWVNGAMAFDGERVVAHGAAQRLEFVRNRR